MKRTKILLSSGLAMFAMFFGAGNVVFPLIVGRFVTGSFISASAGLMLTAILIPFAGLVAMTLYEGNYTAFFKRLGKIPGLLMLILIICLIGPFNAIPRCITLTYATLKLYLPQLNLAWFSASAALLIFVCCWKRGRVIDLLGLVLTPLLLLFLGIILVKGLFFTPLSLELTSMSMASFNYGLRAGYNTMDLLAAFFFSSMVYQTLKDKLHRADLGEKILSTALKASILGAGFLAVIYLGFAWIAASHAHLLDVPDSQLIARIGGVIMGPMGGFVISMTVGMACLTTAIGLATAASEFFQKKVFKDKVGYLPCLTGVLFITFCISQLAFDGIVKMAMPILTICYPGFLALCIVNLLHKTLSFQPVKTPVFAILLLMVLISVL